MKIIEIMPTYALCGVTRFVVDLSNSLAAAHEVVLVVLHSPAGAARKELHPNIRLEEMNKRPGRDIRLCFRLSALLRRERADIIHLHGSNTLFYAAPSILSGWGGRYYYTLHSESSFEIPSRTLNKLAEYALFRSGHCKVIATSAFTAQSLRFPVPVIPPGRAISEQQLADSSAVREVEEIRKRRGGTILLSVSNITPVKNQILLCGAVRKLAEKGYNIELLLIGNAPDTDYFRRVQQLRHERIHFLGPRHNVPAYMAAADFFCLSSLTESGPLVLIEAFFAGLIPVCTPCGDVPNKIRHGYNGYFADDFSEESYLEVLEKALSLTPDQQNTMRREVRRSFREYSMETCSNKHIQLFESTAS